MRIVFDESTLGQADNASRSITGAVFFNFDGTCFPAEGWNDFAVVIATWWLEAVEKLIRGMDKQVLLRFMDGPYWIIASRKTGDTVIVQCVEDRPTAGVVHEEEVNLGALVAQIHSFARSVVLPCVRRGLESNDVSRLRKYLPN